ncbi:hypothetical protein D3C87_1204810 [compost metagenome]
MEAKKNQTQHIPNDVGGALKHFEHQARKISHLHTINCCVVVRTEFESDQVIDNEG